MIKVKDGHLDSLGLLFARYKRPLFGFFYGMNKDAGLCEDLVQNVFYRILKYRYLFRGDGNFRTWMFHIARNVNHDNFRKDKLSNSDPVELWEDKISTDENRGTQYERDEELELLSVAMGPVSATIIPSWMVSPSSKRCCPTRSPPTNVPLALLVSRRT